MHSGNAHVRENKLLSCKPLGSHGSFPMSLTWLSFGLGRKNPPPHRHTPHLSASADARRFRCLRRAFLLWVGASTTCRLQSVWPGGCRLQHELVGVTSCNLWCIWGFVSTHVWLSFRSDFFCQLMFCHNSDSLILWTLPWSTHAPSCYLWCLICRRCLRLAWYAHNWQPLLWCVGQIDDKLSGFKILLLSCTRICCHLSTWIFIIHLHLQLLTAFTTILTVSIYPSVKS